MKLSAHSTLEGKVVEMTKGAVNAEVTLEVAAGVELAVVITPAPVASSGLEADKDADVMIKAGSVMVAVDDQCRPAPTSTGAKWVVTNAPRPPSQVCCPAYGAQGPVMTKLSVGELVEALAALSEEEQLELCDALVDDPRLRDLLEAIDDYLYLEDEDEPPLNLGLDRELN